MAGSPSAETQLKIVRREYKRTIENLQATKKESDEYRARATKAEQEVAEWKRRFDLLLSKTQKDDGDYL